MIGMLEVAGSAPTPPPDPTIDVSGAIKTISQGAKSLGAAVLNGVSKAADHTHVSRNLGWFHEWVVYVTGDKSRFVICLIATVLLSSLLTLKGPEPIRIAGFFAGLFGFGIGTWYAYNFLTRSKDSLFTTAPSLRKVADSLQSNNSYVFWFALAFLVIGLIAAVATKKNLIIRILVGFAVFAGGTTLTILVINLWHSMFG